MDQLIARALISVRAAVVSRGRARARTCLVDVLLAGVPDAGVEAAEQEAVVAGLPAVVHLAGIRLVDAVVDAVEAPLLAAGGLGHALGALAPVGGDEGGGGEEEREQVEGHRQQRAAFARGLHGVPDAAEVRPFIRAGAAGGRGGAWRGEDARRSHARLRAAAP